MEGNEVLNKTPQINRRHQNDCEQGDNAEKLLLYQIEKQPFPQDSEFLDTQRARGIQLRGRIKVRTSQLNVREHPLHKRPQTN